jgi:hypothetical protein
MAIQVDSTQDVAFIGLCLACACRTEIATGWRSVELRVEVFRLVASAGTVGELIDILSSQPQQELTDGWDDTIGL